MPRSSRLTRRVGVLFTRWKVVSCSGGCSDSPLWLFCSQQAPTLAEPEPDQKELAQRRLEQARARLASRSLDADYVVEVGSPAERLLVVADERDAELIVVGHGEHGLLERLVMQPVEEAVARRARRDVLIVH